MITLTREEAQQVLDALEKIIQGCNDVERDEHIHKDGKDVARLVRIDCREPAETLRARLAQPEPEPQEAIAKWIKTNTEHREWYICPKCSYQAPRFKDEWQGLTDEELKEICRQDGLIFKPLKFYRAIEAKLKEKNT